MQKRRRKSKRWRCFFCDEVFRSKRKAMAHFGPDEYEEKYPAACVDPLRTDEAARIKELRDAQAYSLQCQEKANEADDRADMMAYELAEFKRMTKADTVHQLRMNLDSQQGELITARELTKAIREKAPDVYAAVIQ